MESDKRSLRCWNDGNKRKGREGNGKKMKRERERERKEREREREGLVLGRRR